MTKTLADLCADNIRILAASMVEKAKSGHPGGAMGGADFINILFSEFLQFDPSDPTWHARDRFFLDPGHMSSMLYAQQTLLGKFSLEDIKNFRQWGSPTPGHPEVDVMRGIENTSGPLGQGHTYAVGAAIAERFLVARFGEWMSHKTYAFISDGGIQEEISQGAGRLAGHLGLNNLIMFYDSNDIQLSSYTDAVTSENTAAKYEAWGWKTITIDGNNAAEIRKALTLANEEKEKPTLIIGKTIMAKGAVTEAGESFERRYETHGMPLSEAGASYKKTIANLGGDPENPFQIFHDVEQYYQKVEQIKLLQAGHKKETQQQWEKENPEKAVKLKKFLSGKAPEIDYEKIIQKENIASRAASSAVLGYFAQHVENMIVSSADLSNSDKTDGFLKHTKAFTKGDFSGAFLQSGVSELTMAAIANGLALHGGTIPVVATFFVFSDYMKPALRMAALMQLPVKYVWTHDAFRVGEDGPTHQPVEHEAQLRLMEQLYNHAHQRSTLVLRPADAVETTIAWKMALENTKSPTALIFSRQNIKDLPAKIGSTRFVDAMEAAKGAYIVNDVNGKPDIVLIGNGSEVSTLFDGAQKLLSEKKLNIQIVSVISEGLFRDQPAEYQQKILPVGVPVFGLTAGLPATLQGLVGIHGKIFAMNHFGYSAPAKVLDEKFGFTPENVYNEVCKFLNI